MQSPKFIKSLVIALISLSAMFQVANGQAVQSAPSTAKVELQVPLVIDGREAEEIWINTGQGRFRFTAEIADEQSERSIGLMHREKMAPTHGMLFQFETVRNIQMWMRNTPLSLDMVFINNSGEVMNIAERTTPFSDAIIESGEPVSFVLEINAGVSRLIGLKEGDKIEHRLFTKQ